MATLQELTHQQINEAIEAGTQRSVPATVTVRTSKSWANLYSRMLALRDDHLLIAAPVPHEGQPAREFHPADKLGLSFKLKHHKHVFTATVASVDRAQVGDQDDAPVLTLCFPTRMHRLQRRAFLRVDVPRNRIARASFWLGGCEAEPAGTSPRQPVWAGRVSNISAGGFQIVTQDQPLTLLGIGEVVGVRLAFGAGNQTVYADALFRHLVEDGEDLLLGFQFLALAHNRQGRRALQVISTKVSEFQRESNYASRRRGAS